MNGTEWIEPVYDRTSGDVLHAEDNPQEISKGAYNYEDLNRVENNTRFVADEMLRRGITSEYITLNSKYNWSNKDIPTRTDMNRIINNILLLQALSNPEILPDLDTIQTGGQMTWMLANAIEKNLLIIKDQPLPEPDTYYLEVVNGTGSGYYTEDTVVEIQGIPYGDQSSFMVFDRWIGDPEDLKQIANVYDQKTTFTMWHKDARVEAQFKIQIPRTFKIINGFINDETGGTERTFLPGDVFDIQANDAPNDMVFYQWLFNDDGLEDSVTAPMASTTSVSMPDADLTLTAFYIHPGLHELVVNNGDGGGWYQYGETPSISANPPSSRYTFSYWSGDTGYLDEGDINSSYARVNMPDKKITLTANFEYQYSYNTVTVMYGSGGGENLRQGTSIQIVGDQAGEGEGFDYWELAGEGYLFNENSASTTFTVGDGNAVIVAHYGPLHKISVTNQNNNGMTTESQHVEGKSVQISTQEYVGNYRFDHWEENGKQLTTSRTYRFTMGTIDRAFTAVYTDRQYYDLTVNNGTGSGRYLENSNVAISANQAPEGYIFDHWSTSGIASIVNNRNSNTVVTTDNQDGSVTAQYVDNTHHNLTVNNGTGSGNYRIGTSVRIHANSAPENYRFSHWTIDSGDVTLSNENSSSPYAYIHNEDSVVTAHYSELPLYTLTVNGGSGSGQYRQGTSIRIIADPAPDTYRFLNWSGDVENDELSDVFASTSNVVSISKNMTVTANYFIPEEVDSYELTVINGRGSGSHKGGSEVEISADRAPDGYEFWKWDGDVSTVLDKYAEETTLVMPLYPITITALYKQEGSIDLYTLKVNYGKCEIIDGDSSNWESTGDFEEGTKVNIKADTPPNGFRFDYWEGDIDNIAEIYDAETSITIGNQDVEITAKFIEMEKYSLVVIDGYGTDKYYPGTVVEVVFNKEDNEDEQYDFKYWTGDVETLAQPDKETTTLVMPEHDITIRAEYDTNYHLEVVNGSGSGYYLPGTKVDIKANIPPEENQKFSRWTGDVSILSKQFNEKSVATIPESAARVVANYRTEGEENSIGYTALTLDKISDINNEDINIISGTINNGFLLTDAKGHIYYCSIVGDTTSTFARLTKTQKGGNVYE